MCRALRCVYNFGGYGAGNVERTWFPGIRSDAFYLERGANQFSITQKDFGYAMSQGGNLYRRGAAEIKGEGFGITEYHNSASFLPKLGTQVVG